METTVIGKCPSVDEWIKKMCVYTYTHTHTQWNVIQSLKKVGNSAICNNMDGSRGYYA